MLVEVVAGRSGAHEWRTADPLASLGMTKKERAVAKGEGRCKERAVAKGESGCKRRERLQKERVVARKGRLLNRGIVQA
jgi:hypothetical protein